MKPVLLEQVSLEQAELKRMPQKQLLPSSDGADKRRRGGWPPPRRTGAAAVQR